MNPYADSVAAIIIASLWPISAVVVALLAFRIAQKFVPAAEEKVFRRITELEKQITDQQTEISKLNVMFGIGQTQKNRENLIRGMTGISVGQ